MTKRVKKFAGEYRIQEKKKLLFFEYWETVEVFDNIIEANLYLIKLKEENV